MITKRSRQQNVYAQEPGFSVSDKQVHRFGGSSENSQKPHGVYSGAKYIVSSADLIALEHNFLGSLS